MKSYRQLVESLPARTVVFTFGGFNPPTVSHQLPIQFVKQLAKNSRADHAIFTSSSQDNKKNPLNIDRKIHYLKLLYPETNFIASTDSIIDIAKILDRRYKNILLVAGSDKIVEYKAALDTANNTDTHFDSIKVISTGERDADDSTSLTPTKLKSIAAKGNLPAFRKFLPSSLREIDARRMMNDIQEGLGQEVIKEQIKFNTDNLREQYFRGEIYNIGDLVETVTGQRYEIIRRGTNHLLCKTEAGNIENKWIHEVYQVQK